VHAFGADTNSSNLNATQIKNLEIEISTIDASLQENFWNKKYESFLEYKKLELQLKELELVLAQLIAKKRKSKDDLVQMNDLKNKKDVLVKKLQLLSGFSHFSMENLLQIDEMPPLPEVKNPISLIFAYSYIKDLKNTLLVHENDLSDISKYLETLHHKSILLERLLSIVETTDIQEEFDQTQRIYTEVESSYSIAQTSVSLFSKKVDEAVVMITKASKEQVYKITQIGIFILIVIGLSFLFKLASKKYVEDNEKLYLANKIINLINFIIIATILVFAYIENVSYVVTVLGFASAGLAIAMKDLFMSILGWLVIVFGGSFHVGDRIKVIKEGHPYVGDILDISLLRMTILEDVTLTSYMQNRRSGRVVFVPNNYVFTELISNYTHGTLKTVWDGIDITITFDSNHKKATHLIKEIVKKFSKGYTDIARQQLNKLRSQYSLKNTNVEPRIYTFLEPYGVRISVWYMTNSYAALTLRSTISAEIVDTIKQSDDITIAYPTQQINLKNEPIPPSKEAQAVVI
jgi:small-conductance mechanosensitive channel